MADPIKLKLADVIEAGRKAYLEGRLSAQGPTPDCAYRDASGRPCIIGAALSDKQALDLESGAPVDDLIYKGALITDDGLALLELQEAHDMWALDAAMGVSNSLDEAALRQLLDLPAPAEGEG